MYAKNKHNWLVVHTHLYRNAWYIKQYHGRKGSIISRQFHLQQHHTGADSNTGVQQNHTIAPTFKYVVVFCSPPPPTLLIYICVYTHFFSFCQDGGGVGGLKSLEFVISFACIPRFVLLGGGGGRDKVMRWKCGSVIALFVFTFYPPPPPSLSQDSQMTSSSINWPPHTHTLS